MNSNLQQFAILAANVREPLKSLSARNLFKYVDSVEAILFTV
jgi:hypothetical protein